MVSVTKKEFLMADMRALALKYGVDKSGTKQSLINRISIAIADEEETQSNYYWIGVGHKVNNKDTFK